MPVIALFGEERITQKLNRGFGNSDTKDNESSEDDEVEIEPEDIDWEGLNFVWDDETLGVDPLNAVIRRETRENMLAGMTDKQREVFILYHKYGWTQQQIAHAVGIAQQKPTKQQAAAMQKLGFISTETIQKIDFTKVEKAEASVQKATLDLDNAQIKLKMLLKNMAKAVRRHKLQATTMKKLRLNSHRQKMNWKNNKPVCLKKCPERIRSWRILRGICGHSAKLSRFSVRKWGRSMSN